jgi:FkbM family methyltransferase
VSEERTADAPAWARAAAWLIPRLPFGRYVLLNAIADVSDARFCARLGADAGGYRFEYDPRDEILRELCFTGRYAAPETALLRALLAPGMTFVDVGANIGYFSLLAAHLVGKTGRVCALEPDPRIFALLSRNVKLNDVPQIRLMQVAAAETSGRAVLSGHAESGSNRGISHLGAALPGEIVFEVATQSLDELIVEEHIERVHVCKIDVEGAELRVLNGLTSGLAAGRYERIMLELHPRAPGFDYAPVRDLMTRHGYEGYRIVQDDIRRLTYARNLRVRELIVATPELEPADPWPHQLWLAPGVSAPT